MAGLPHKEALDPVRPEAARRDYTGDVRIPGLSTSIYCNTGFDHQHPYRYGTNSSECTRWVHGKRDGPTPDSVRGDGRSGMLVKILLLVNRPGGYIGSNRHYHGQHGTRAHALIVKCSASIESARDGREKGAQQRIVGASVRVGMFAGLHGHVVFRERWECQRALTQMIPCLARYSTGTC